MTTNWTLDPDRCFDPDATQRLLARELYQTVKDLPIVSPHGHVDPALLADPEARFGSPVDLLITPDHYVFCMLYSQGIKLEELGIPPQDGAPMETDHRRIWQRFADHFYLFRGTPSGLWLADELVNVFGVEEKLTSASAQRIYAHLEARLTRPDYSPRELFARFNIEVLCTTDPATSRLEHHRALRKQGWEGKVRPTFRPDAVTDLSAPGWRENIRQLGEVGGEEVSSYRKFVRILEERRAFFNLMGATATDQAVLVPYTDEMAPNEVEAVFQRALRGEATQEDAHRFNAHMLMEMARMSLDDRLVMQIHAGSFRNHNEPIYRRFGRDMGADIPMVTDFTRNLLPLLNKYGNDPRLTLILFTLDESTYARELAPLAGHYPALKLGPPWWYHDSVNGMSRYLDQVSETAGLYNLAGFNDDTRAFCSIPARHDVWRRVTCNWLAGRLARGLIDEEDAHEMALDCAVRLAKRAYRLP
jgi:glucuronate isomerase